MTTALNLDVDSIKHLELEAAIGFGGQVPGGLHIHPNGKQLLYALGNCIVVRDIGNAKATSFLQGHNDRVSCVAISKSGRYVASGQLTHMGFQADICVFDFSTQKVIHRMVLHKVKVQALAFSSDEQFLASVGGQDDNTLVVWDLNTGRPLCGGPAATELSTCVAFFNNSSDKLVTAGNGFLRCWEVDFANRKINHTDVNVGTMRRDFRCIVVEATDRYAYIGSASGDVLCIQIAGQKIFKMAGPQKKFSGGVLTCTRNSEGDILVGTGGGDVALLSKIDLHVLKTLRVNGAVTSATAMGDHYFVGTAKSNVYYLNANTFKDELRQTCHHEAINDVVFPFNYSEVFATCSQCDIRVWNARTSVELLRIQVGTLECNCIRFSMDGKMILSGWSDGKVRAFGPQSGKLMFVINDAHKLGGMKRVSGRHQGVTAICADHHNERMVTGGADAEVRVWKVSPFDQKLEAALKEHKATINAVAMIHDDTECVSASDDGSCIVWDLIRHVRRNIMYSQTYFKAATFFIDESQLLTTGSDKKVTYWDAVDCTAIRELEGSTIGEINSVDIADDGQQFVTGGGDKMVKVWDYDEGSVVSVGLGHSGNITKVKFAPDGKTIVSVSDEGAIMIWKV